MDGKRPAGPHSTGPAACRRVAGGPTGEAELHRRACRWLDAHGMIEGAVYHAHRVETERAAIQYDYRWLYRNDWLLASLLHPRIMRFNREQVYGNAVMPQFLRRRMG